MDPTVVQLAQRLANDLCFPSRNRPHVRFYFEGPNAQDPIPYDPIELGLRDDCIIDMRFQTWDENLFQSFFALVHQKIMLQMISDPIARNGNRYELYFRGFPDIRRLPNNVASVFHNVTNCIISDCRNLRFLEAIFQFRNLGVLGFIDCPSLESLSTLLFNTRILRALSFTRCGLSNNPDAAWGFGVNAMNEASQMIPALRLGPFRLEIINCDGLTSLPQSIIRLGDYGRQSVSIYLINNRFMRDIIYRLNNLMDARMTIYICNCPLIISYALETLTFLPGATNFRIALCQQPDCSDRIHRLGVPQLDLIFEDGRLWETYDVPTLDRYFRTQHNIISQHLLLLF